MEWSARRQAGGQDNAPVMAMPRPLSLAGCLGQFPAMSESKFWATARYDDVPPGKTRAVAVNGRDILLCNSDGQIHAIAALCSHADEPLACGRIRLGWIACPAHGARFDLETGEPLTGPASAPIATYRVRIVDGMIEVAA